MLESQSKQDYALVFIIILIAAFFCIQSDFFVNSLSAMVFFSVFFTVFCGLLAFEKIAFEQ